MDKIINLPENMAASDTEIRFVSEKKPKHLLLSALIAVFFIGVAYGSVLAGSANAETSESLRRMTDAFLLQREADTFLSAFLSSLLSSGLFVLLLFLCGFSAVGQPGSFFLVVFRGIGLGVTMGHFYSDLGIKGILMSMALIVPASIISSYAILLAGRESIKLSNRFFRVLVCDDVMMPAGILKTYTVKFLILTLLILLSAAVNGLCTRIFAPMF